MERIAERIPKGCKGKEREKRSDERNSLIMINDSFTSNTFIIFNPIFEAKEVVLM